MDSENEIVARHAPRWAWNVIDDALWLDCMHRDNAEAIAKARRAMLVASENPFMEALSFNDAQDEQ